ncbi:hypothetical protein B0I35DRAFT_411414 [Stachybotrys elegans]|uniref:Protein-arginine deiminase C-terminal domain-containing protein n=1 Tax=Stachybotrys elegans TaxID=80388 RepID=A0A8K0SRE3_9HYPO|nr:hypothetical protein B0I35DRAFT_411414 [Stachybotrys elegans]
MVQLSRHQLLGLALAISQCSVVFSATILADTNRDGVVDVTGDSDVEGKQTWTQDRGALFLPNIGDTDRRCSQALDAGTPDTQLDDCHDASDNVLRNPLYLAPVRTLADGSLSSTASGSINITDQTAAEFVRIFVKEQRGWTFVGPDHTFDAEALRGGLELGVDARDIRRPGGWDGRATLALTVTDGDNISVDTVAMRVAPVLTHHHLQQAERVFASFEFGWDEESDLVHTQYMADLGAHAKEAGIAEPLHVFNQYDRWTQDFMEPGYASIPGPEGPVAIRISIRSAQPRLAGRQVFTDLREDGVGAIQHPPTNYSSTLESTGNVETIPPYTHNGTSFPAGRVIIGEWDGLRPTTYDFFVAQEVQMPLLLDTSWLYVGHVDEFLQFLPSDNERGWILMADDPMAGLAVLKKASAAGHGGVRAVSRPDGLYCVSRSSIDEELAGEKFEEDQIMSKSRIDDNIQRIKEATGLTDEEIFRVPALFYREIQWPEQGCNDPLRDSRTQHRPPQGLDIVDAAGPRLLRVRRRQYTESPVIARWPGAINGVVLSDNYVLAPDPWGPIIDGRDILKEAVSAAYKEAGHTVNYMDDYFTHHLFGGEVHCGSNTWRKMDTPWW